MAGWCDKLYASIEPLDPYLEDRVLIVCGLYLFSFLVLDVAIWKASVVVFVVYVCLILPIGRRVVEGLCLLLLTFAMAKWTDIAGINALAEAARNSLVHLAQH